MKKAKELPTKIQHLRKYVPPDPGRIRHSDIWERAKKNGGNGVRWVVEFKKDTGV